MELWKTNADTFTRQILSVNTTGATSKAFENATDTKMFNEFVSENSDDKNNNNFIK